MRMNYMREMKMAFRYFNYEKNIKSTKKSNIMDITTVIYVLMIWFFLGWIVDMMVKEEEDKRMKYDVPERYKLK